MGLTQGWNRHRNMTDFGDRKGTLNMETRDKHKDKDD